MKDNYVYIFVHLPKTAGSTFNKHIEKNFKKKEIINVKAATLDLLKTNAGQKEFLEAIEKYYSGMTRTQRRDVKVIYGHTIPFGIQKIFGKKARYVTFLRRPGSRTVSFYNYYLTRYNLEPRAKKNIDFYQVRLLINNKVPTFKKWCQIKYGEKKSYLSTKTMYDYFELLGYIKEGRNDVKKIENFLKKFYFVGTTEDFDEDSLFLYHLMGFNKFFINQNISKKHVAKRDVSTAQSLLKKKNKRDELIYKMALEKNEKFKKDTPGFKKNVALVRFKKKVFTPITQIVFDFIESLRMFSAFLRTKSKTYSLMLDKVKGIER